MKIQADVVIVGTGAAGLFCALKLPEDYRILMITKDEVDRSDSFLAQGGICMLKNEEDFASYFEDTMKAGHYENNRDSVEMMIRSSGAVIQELIDYGVAFERDGDQLAFTREGGHSKPRILFHADVTGREITSTLLEKAKKRSNITILDHTMMLDILTDLTGQACVGLVIQRQDGRVDTVESAFTVLACGGLGGLFKHSTNFRHITGDALAIAYRHHIQVDHVDYIQIHPTTLYSEKPGRRFLISESVRGEGAMLFNDHGERFVNELLPRDVVTQAIMEQMEKDNVPHVWLSLEKVPEETIRGHFPNIYNRCLEEGYDMTKDLIPVVPAQHYFMGGIHVDLTSKTTMERLYAIGETSCNGVHGRNRLASNSLLESMVFAGQAAEDIRSQTKAALTDREILMEEPDLIGYQDVKRLKEEYKRIVLEQIEREKRSHG